MGSKLPTETSLRESIKPQTISCRGSNKQEDLVVVLVQSSGAGLACSGHQRSTTTVSGLPCLQTNVDIMFSTILHHHHPSPSSITILCHHPLSDNLKVYMSQHYFWEIPPLLNLRVGVRINKKGGCLTPRNQNVRGEAPATCSRFFYIESIFQILLCILETKY